MEINDDLVKEAIKEVFDTDSFLKVVVDDVNFNAEWWSKQIVKPLKKTLEKVLFDKDFLKQVLEEYMDREFYDKLSHIFESMARDYVRQKVDSALPRLTIEVKK